MKPLTIIYCGENGEAGKALAHSLRTGENCVLLASGLAERDFMPADHVVVMQDVPERQCELISLAYLGKVERARSKALEDAPVPQMSAATRFRVDEMPKRRGRPPGSKNKAA